MTRQRVIVFCGPPCSGKSTLAASYCVKKRIPLLQKDTFVARLFPGSSNGPQERQLAYRALHLSAELLLEASHTVAVDGVYQLRAPREELESIVSKTNSLLYVITCRVTPQEAVDRFTGRPAGHPAVDLTVTKVYEKALRYPFSGVGLEVDTAQGVPQCLSQVEQYLSCGKALQNGIWTASGAPSGSSASRA